MSMSESQIPNLEAAKAMPHPRGSSGPLYIALADSLQNKIVSGEYPPGSALPSVSDLAEQYHVANMTARQAIGLLAKKGFVTRRHGKGTFVQEGAGKLLIGILVGPSITEEATYFYRATVNAMREAIEARGWTSRTFDGLTEAGLPRPMTFSTVKQLRMDLNSQIFHGFIELSSGVKGLAEMEEGFPLPKVKCDSMAPQNDIEFDFYDFGRKSVEFFASRGISDLVYIRPYFQTGLEETSVVCRDMDGMFDAVNALGLPKPLIDNIILDAAPGMSTKSDEILYEHALSFFRKRKRKKAKYGLIVNDDIGMRTIALAIAREQVQVPQDCEILCLSNEGIHHHYGIPVHRYEQPLSTFAIRALDVLQMRMFDEPLPHLPICIQGVVTEIDGGLSKSEGKKEVKELV
jgi:DNA-binding transcriptional regulator YhcF (GntR family)